MFLDLTPDQRALRDELRAYFAALITPELRRAMDEGGAGPGSAYRATVKRMGADGWLGVGWPKEYGGGGFSAVEQFIFFEEAQRVEAPIPLVTLNTVGPALMQFGSDAQKKRFLPAILAGDVHFAIGYSEPEAGTDLAALTTRAERDGDEWVINGQKMWTTGAEDADYIWLACRTDPDAPKHAGISMFLVDTTLPGFKVTPIHTLVGHRTNATYYENVRVPTDALVGDLNRGWSLITTQLNLERSSIVGTATVERLLDAVCRHLAAEGRLEEPWVQLALARVRAKAEALHLMNWRVAWSITEGTFNAAAASAVKVYGTEFHIEAYKLLLEVVGPIGSLKAGSPGAVLGGHLERQYRRAILTTFGGGVNEIQRDIIAMLGLRMPPSPRYVDGS
jgi:alkylation response protein AidB-like acyl-CoA dehydrogenase